MPETAFRLYAVVSRYPHNLANEVALEPVSAGVYTCRRGTDVIRIIVASQVPKQAHNALLHLFSAQAARIDYGAVHYQRRSTETSSLLERLLVEYRGEGITMAYTMADWRRDYPKELVKRWTAEERRAALEALTPEELRDTLRGLSPEKLLEALSLEEIEQVLQKRMAERSSRPKKPRRRG